jgi:DNA-binding CsgD family transcriptional regulator
MENGAIARLTEREKDCLRRWLAHQTAKEIALDLGISPHAVEKRLKMARAKLGVSSSLDAARLLAEAEGYQRAGPQPPDLAGGADPRKSQLAQPLTLGVLTMTIVSAAVLVLAMQVSGGASGGVAPLPTTIGGVATLPAPDTSGGAQVIYGVYGVGKLVKPEPGELPALLAKAFRKLDVDRSRFIEADEAPAAARVTFQLGNDNAPPPAPTQIAAADAQAKWIAEGDRDRNGKLDEREYADWLGPLYAAHGMPVELVETAR